MLILKIADSAAAERVLGGVVKGIYAIAAIQIITAILIAALEADYFLAGGAAADGFIYALLAFLAHRFKSRVAVVILLLVSVVAVIASALNANVLLAALLMWFSIRTAQAVFVLRKAAPSPEGASDPPVESTIGGSK